MSAYVSKNLNIVGTQLYCNFILYVLDIRSSDRPWARTAESSKSASNGKIMTVFSWFKIKNINLRLTGRCPKQTRSVSRAIYYFRFRRYRCEVIGKFGPRCSSCLTVPLTEWKGSSCVAKGLPDRSLRLMKWGGNN